MQSEEDSAAKVEPVPRGELVRDIALLQFKLVVDGLRDFILVPVSMIAGMISLFRAGDPAGDEFYRLLHLGRRSERWINLFGAADRMPLPDHEPDHFPDADIDSLMGKLEKIVVDDYHEGGMSRQARNRLHELLTALRRQRGRRKE
jgi:hypothetical protein